jgi:hypothetical protein
MYQQIKELKIRACKWASKNVSSAEYENAADQKFAELIVKECLGIADWQKKWVEDMEVFNEQDANWNKARIQQSQQIVDKIKQHFGVEE